MRVAIRNYALVLIMVMLSAVFLGDALRIDKVPTAESQRYEMRTVTYRVSERGTEYRRGGSGVMIQEGIILTAAHVVAKADGPLVVWHPYSKKRSGATPIHVDEERDIALLSVNLDCPCATPDLETPPLDGEVYVVGYPRGSTSPVLTVGAVQRLSGVMFLTSADATYGNSGGGTFALRDGEAVLVGMLRAIVFNPRGETTNYLSLSVQGEAISESLSCSGVDLEFALPECEEI